jgi:hypothetical protein
MNAWMAHPEFRMGPLTLELFEAKLDGLMAIQDRVLALRTELAGLIRERDDQATEMIELITRVRSGVRGGFGADSPEYAQVGGTRQSQRKPRKRRNSSQK